MQQNSAPTASTDSDIKVSPLVWMTARDLFTAILVGMMTGVVTSGVGMLMNRFVFGAVLCRTETGGDCVNAPLYAAIVAMVIGAIFALVALARVRMFRPLLAVIASSIALWGFYVFTAPLDWYWELLAAAVIFGLVYGIFSWIARIRSFIMAVVVAIVIVVAIRFMLVA